MSGRTGQFQSLCVVGQGTKLLRLRSVLEGRFTDNGAFGVDDMPSLNGVTPGPSCVIPEDKKIFRVCAEASGFEPRERLALLEVKAGVDGQPPLPVPHMYSA
jgi:hypothetical protein